MNIKQILLSVLLVVIAVGAMFFSGLIGIITDWWWFSEVKYTEIFLTGLAMKLGVGSVVGVGAALFLGVNLFIAIRSRTPWSVNISEQVAGRPMTLAASVVKGIAFVVSVTIGFFVGAAVSVSWQTILKFIYATPFGVVDPIFSKDVSFYVFSLPAYTLGIGIVQFLVVLSLAACGVLYFFQGIWSLRQFFPRRGSVRIQVMNRKPRVHLGILLALFFAISAVSTVLSIYELVLSSGGIVFGATAAHVTILRPLLMASAFVFAVSSLFSLIFAFSGKLAPVFISITLSFVVSVASGVVLPVYQKLIVSPNELVQETPYIKHNIASTRVAYGLENIEGREITREKPLTAQSIADNNATLKNVRLWDRDPLLSTFSQIQEIRTYYEFRSIDNDRYTLNGDIRQLMFSPRELASDSLPNKSWINERLTFTHGYGITAGPVNQVTPEGLPVLFVKDLPPKSDIPELEIKRPEIYYGELANDYVIVKTKSLEFDYPKGEENVYTTYEGTGGVQISSLFQRLVYAIKFKELKILLSGDITNESRILAHRVISERVSKIAPFLTYDKDPYMVVADGKIKWIVDAYTSTDRYPYSQPIVMGTQKVNYIKNAVKVVVDAYNGTVDFYIADQNDPLIKTYAKAFPHSFRPISDLPQELKAHIRYPEDIFAAQTAVYATYHMDDPQVFYNKEDQWEIPSYAERTAEQAHSSSMEPRHMIMKLPGEKKEEFILMIPFTPRAKDNLSAWMVARNDGEYYGSLVVYRFPKDKLVFGPKQIIGRINQDAEVSRQISLWDQRGSQVIQGSLLVIPIEESLLYVRPLYLKADTGKIPELKRVIVAYENKVAMEETFEQALAKIFNGTSKQEVREQTPANGTPQTIPSANTDFQTAREAYEAALRAQQEGNWAKYGEHIRRLGEILRKQK
ncbi:MAG: UPF0182 family protein [bacterium]|nr:UPF0182 family protein [bacterium]